MTEPNRIRGISIVCVFNNAEVRKDCLDRSIDAYGGPVPVDYIPVDNTAHDFRSAGAALNHGAARARHEVVVFVHQDVFLHSLDRIAQAAALLDGDEWGVLGANGVTDRGVSVGRIRDRRGDLARGGVLRRARGADGDHDEEREGTRERHAKAE